MLKKNLNIVWHYFVILVLTTFLIISLGYAWYATNHEVDANNIMGAIADESLEITDSAIYKHEVGVEDPDNPYDENVDDDTVTGMLTGEKIFYSLSLHSKDDEIKDITIRLGNIDGGEFFTKPAVMCTAEEFNSYQGKTPYGTYKPDQNSNETINTYFDSEGEFYFSSEEGIYYKNYFYEVIDENGKVRRFNMCDVYTIRLYAIYVGETEIHGDGEQDYHRIYTCDPEENDFVNFTRTNGLSKTIDTMDIAYYDNWHPNNEIEVNGEIFKTKILTFTFEIVFDYEYLEDYINTNCISSKQLILNNIYIIADESEE